MSDPKPPYSLSYDLRTLPKSGAEFRLVPSADAKAAIAAWAKVSSVETFAATVQLSHQGEDGYAYKAQLDADVVQACVVTLEPVRSHMHGDVERHFRVTPARKTRLREIDISLTDEDETEVLESRVIDLAAPILEEFALNVDPYPHAPGATFAAPADDGEVRESPFAVLERLKAAAAEKPKAAKRR